MGVIQKFSKRHGVGGAAPVTPPTGHDPAHNDGRERLRFLDAELAKAKDAVNELDARLDRLAGIIRSADAAHTALQEAIAADGGAALAEYAAGKAFSHPIAKLIATKEAAAAVKGENGALQKAQKMLDAARSEVVRLETEKDNAAIFYLKARASEAHKLYIRAFNDLCVSYDQLCGIAVALDATGHAAMMTTALPVPIAVPGFNMSSGPAHGPSDLVTMRHVAGEAKVGVSRAKFMQARERLRKDADAELDDLIGPQFQYASDRDL
jgi:hypothetical protein